MRIQFSRMFLYLYYDEDKIKKIYISNTKRNNNEVIIILFY